MPNGNNQNLRWPGAGRRIPSPTRPVQPTGFEPLAAMAQSWMGQQQAQQKALQSAFPAMVAAKAIEVAKPGEAAFQLGGQSWKFSPTFDYATALRKTQLAEAKRKAGAPDPTLMTRAQMVAQTELGGAQFVGLDEESRAKYDRRWKELYNELATASGYAKLPIEEEIEKPKVTPISGKRVQLRDIKTKKLIWFRVKNGVYTKE